MTKEKILNQIKNTGIVAVIRAESEEKALNITEACTKGDVNASEITFTIPSAMNIISPAFGKKWILKKIKVEKLQKQKIYL